MSDEKDVIVIDLPIAEDNRETRELALAETYEHRQVIARIATSTKDDHVITRLLNKLRDLNQEREILLRKANSIQAAWNACKDEHARSVDKTHRLYQEASVDLLRRVQGVVNDLATGEGVECAVYLEGCPEGEIRCVLRTRKRGAGAYVSVNLSSVSTPNLYCELGPMVTKILKLKAIME